MHYLLVIFFLLFSFSCSESLEDSESIEDSESGQAICEEAAVHREKCTGEYITPPECTKTAQLQSQELLDTACEDMDAEFKDSGKADGAFCDWFGAGCTPDESIFIGKTCTESSECGAGFCVESHCFDGVTSPAFSKTMDLFTDSIRIEGSKTHILVDAVETRAYRTRLIQEAEHYIHFSAFIIEDDEMGEEMITLFSEAVKRGVEARVIVDATVQWKFSEYSVIQQLAEAGVEVIVFNPVIEWADVRLLTPMTINDRLHEKILIADGTKAIMGGRNIGNSYLLANKWRDTDVYVEGPGVDGIHDIFKTDWKRISEFEKDTGCRNQAKYGFACPSPDHLEAKKYSPEFTPLGRSITRAILNNPHTQDTPQNYFAYLALVRAAKSSITITNSYFVPPRRLRRHLKAAAQRGVKVNVLTNSKGSTDAKHMYYASINYYRELIGAGINIYQYRGSETMHAKTMIIDDEVVVVGSYNMDPRSAVDNSESIVLIEKGAAVNELVQATKKDFEFADLASFDLPFSEMVKARAFRLAEPLL